MPEQGQRIVNEVSRPFLRQHVCQVKFCKDVVTPSIEFFGAEILHRGFLKTGRAIRHAGVHIAQGNCYDDAPIESFWQSLKNETVIIKDLPPVSMSNRRLSSTSPAAPFAPRLYLAGAAEKFSKTALAA